MALGFYFDVNKCTGCRTCHIACKDKHNLNIGPVIRRVLNFEVGTYPNVDGYRYAAACYHCENAKCVEVCPTAALCYAEDGTVQLDDVLCIGCQKCAVCPYDAPQFNEDRGGVMVKCDSCKSLRDTGENPVCVDACTMRCLKFGDLDQLAAEHGPGLVRELPILPTATETEPRLLIKPKPASLREDFREIEI